MIIGATEADEAGNDNKGYVRIYEQQGADWVAVSDKIFGIADDDKSPTSIDINARGDVIIIGDKLNDNTATNSGVVRVYEQNAAGNWDLKGTVFDWLTALGEMGADVAISADGNTVAMSAKTNGGEGEIRIYSFDAGAWTLVGNPILGDGTDQWGKTIDLSADGSRIVLGTNRTFGVGSIGVYELVDGDWQLLTEPVQGNSGGSNFASLSGMTRLSDDGTRIIVGAYWDDEGGPRAGKAQVYEITPGCEDTDIIEVLPACDISIEDLNTLVPVCAGDIVDFRYDILMILRQS